MRLLTAGSLVRVQLEEPLYRGIAQLVEHRSPKPSAEGSIPSAPAIFVSQYGTHRKTLEYSRVFRVFEFI